MILKQASYNVGLKLSGQLLSFIATIIVARSATTSVVGIIAYANSILIFIQSIASSGLGASHVNLIKNGEDASKCNTILLLSSLALNIGIFTATIMLMHFDVLHIESSSKKTAILLFAAGSIVFTALQVPRSYFNSQIKQFKATFPETLSNYIYSGGRIIVTFFQPTAIWLAIVRPVSFLIVAPYSLSQFFKETGFGKIDLSLIKKFLEKFQGYFIITFAQSLPNSIDKILLGLYVSDDSLGIYSIPSRIQQIVKTITLSLMLVLFPHFISLIKENRRSEISKIVSDYIEIVFFVGLPLLYIASLWAINILSEIFGDAYESAGLIFVLFLVLSFVDVIAQPFITLNASFSDFKKSNKFNAMYIFLFLSFFLFGQFFLELTEQHSLLLMVISLLLSKLVLSFLYIGNEYKKIPFKTKNMFYILLVFSTNLIICETLQIFTENKVFVSILHIIFFYSVVSFLHITPTIVKDIIANIFKKNNER